MRLDYSVVDVPNQNGELSAHYPAKLLIPEHEVKRAYSFEASTYGEYQPQDDCDLGTPRNGGGGSDSRASPPSNRDQLIVDGKLDAQRLRNLILKARRARCRARFPLPVILYNGKYVCRSATLSGGPEIYGRSGLEYFAYAAESELQDQGGAGELTRTLTIEVKFVTWFFPYTRRDCRSERRISIRRTKLQRLAPVWATAPKGHPVA